MEITTKQELKELICSGKNKSSYYSKETAWKKIFTNFYIELLTWDFPTDFTFMQKIYHYINDDPELKLVGVCPECGCRCNFLSIKSGYNYYCSKKCANKSRDKVLKMKQTKLSRYGDPSYNNTEKRKETCLERYGTGIASQSIEVKEKIKTTCKEKSSVIVEKRKATCIEKYGDENFNNRDKAKETCLEKYNSEYVFQSDYFKDSRHQTLVERYNVDSPLKSEIFKDKREQTCLDRYGKKCVTQTDEFIKKSYQTKKKNNSFNTSKIEEQLKQYLTENNIPYIYQYTSDRYPFNCDFYFPDKDLYVEIQGTWTHGGKPFTDSEEDKILLEKWKSKETDFYKNAIETWTVRDVKKRAIAKENRLNYLEIFSCELDECLKQINIYI